ncbi:hypothetical protein BZA05DRAFT_447326 [Tricharina praecox]|uniref:uncharacterized protein n=1 Tax=Tricharina praecox TaxID=43433 RepID=UPI00221F2BEE|nr:uncharacterized protein BZA05DRAFT_447326 [Tricharina praecox]KAI5846684.1 hypothetical protein BZA05DRAFT_447326 [Tricharina praecox]
MKIRGTPPKEAIEAIRYLMLNNEDGNLQGRENLTEWYTCEVRRHFMRWVKKECDIPSKPEDPAALLEKILNTLTGAQSIYLYQFRTFLVQVQIVEPSPRKTPRRGMKKKDVTQEVNRNDPRIRLFLRSLNSIMSYSLPDPAWSELVYTVFLELCGVSVGISMSEEEEAEEEEASTIISGNTTEADDAIYDRMPQSFLTETDLDGDSIIATDEGTPIIPAELDGLPDFDHYKKEPKGTQAEARRKVLKLWELMERIGVGGGGRRGERVFAEVINTLITMYICQTFAQRWGSPSIAGRELEDWVENTLARLIVDILFCTTVNDLDGAGDVRLDKLSPRESLRVTRESIDKRRRGGMDLDFVRTMEEEQKRRREDLETWKKIAIGRLGRLRVNELFDIIVDWPQSLGGVEDLKTYISTPQTRAHLTATFSAALSARILHPAAATSDVLGAYVRLIRAFTVLDPRGVLLDRVSKWIRRYLREREDTVRVIVRGIMSESLVGPDIEEGLSELATELGKGIPALNATSGGLEEMDYDDMNWVPDPIDAGPEFRRNKGLDVVGSLITLYESKEVWLKEVQNILSARLLAEPVYDFHKEIRTIELLKLRFGEPPTQNCDVMLKDMRDSKRQDSVIREMARSTAPLAFGQLPPFHAKVLSHLFWPELKQDEFRLPPVITQAMKAYQEGFERLKKKRKLEWLLSQGTAALEIELEDRVIVVPDATPAQAAVIHAFNDNDSLDDEPRTMAFEQLEQELNMPASLLRPALAFWTDKVVLREDPPGWYTVLESLRKGDEATSPAKQAYYATENLDIIDEEKARERQVVEQFVIGMLTNGGAMNGDRIGMMLGMLVPGGFRWLNEELGEFLVEMKERGRIEHAPGGWKVV